MSSFKNTRLRFIQDDSDTSEESTKQTVVTPIVKEKEPKKQRKVIEQDDPLYNKYLLFGCIFIFSIMVFMVITAGRIIIRNSDHVHPSKKLKDKHKDTLPISNICNDKINKTDIEWYNEKIRPILQPRDDDIYCNITSPSGHNVLCNIHEEIISIDIDEEYIFGYPVAISCFQKLSFVAIKAKESTTIMNVLLKEWAYLPELRLLNITDLNIMGPIPPELGKSPKLEYLYLYTNNNRSIPNELGDIHTLKELVLHLKNTDDLGGTIPYTLSKLSRLERLVIQNSGQYGTIPPQFGNLKKLEFLDLSENTLHGSIPKQLRWLTRLDSLLLYKNQLSGSLHKLDTLKVSKRCFIRSSSSDDNCFECPIPYSLLEKCSIEPMFNLTENCVPLEC